MSIVGAPNESKLARVSGITATKYRIVDADTGASIVLGPVTTGITHTGTLRYKATVTLPSTAGDYELQWDDGSSSWAAIEDVTVTPVATSIGVAYSTTDGVSYSTSGGFQRKTQGIVAFTFIIKQHDLEPPVNGQLKNADGSAINLTTASAVYFIMRSAGGSVFRAPASIVVANPDFTASTTAPHVRYAWGASDTSVVGTYDQEWEIMWPSTRPQTVPNHSYNTVIVEDDLD